MKVNLNFPFFPVLEYTVVGELRASAKLLESISTIVSEQVMFKLVFRVGGGYIPQGMKQGRIRINLCT